MNKEVRDAFNTLKACGYLAKTDVDQMHILIILDNVYLAGKIDGQTEIMGIREASNA